MKAFLLAAGLGSRLYPVTRNMPKCLVPIQGRPILAIWLELLANAGIEEVLINTHYHSEQVVDFAASYHGPSPKLRLAHEPALLGSAGTLAANRKFVEGCGSFLVSYADNLTDLDATRLVQAHREHGGLATMALFRSERPSQCGIVEMDDRGLVNGFEEKPVHPRSNLANAGIYVMSEDVLSLLPGRAPADIAYDLLPRCLGSLYGWVWDGFLMDIGDPLSYERAQTRWSERPPFSTRSMQCTMNQSA